MVDETKNPWKIHQEEKVFSNPWITVRKYDVTDPGEKPGTYSVVEFQNLAIGIVPLDKDLNTWIVGQYRFPLNTYSWEIPEGGGPLNEDPLSSAKRELSEETGIVAKDWTLIQEFNTSNSVTDEKSLIYVAKNLSYENSHPESTEELVVKKIPFNELHQMVLDGKIQDSLTIIAVLKTKILIDENKI